MANASLPTIGKSSGTKTRRVTPPSPTYMSNDQFAKYLSELRSNRTARPGGARPLPPSGGRSTPSRTSLGRHSMDPPPLSQPASKTNQTSPQRMPSQAPSIGTGTVTSRYSMSSTRGRDYYPTSPAVPVKPSEVVPTATYMERGQRWMEKEEAFSLRDAMEAMDIRDGSKAAVDDDSRIYNAALNEAAELVWQHQHGYREPEPDGPYRYKSHLRKNSYAHARTASIGRYGDGIAPSGLGRDPGSRSVSGSSTDSSGSVPGNRASSDSARSAKTSTRPTKPYGSVGAGFRRRSSLMRNISGEVERPFSGDQIWEEPEGSVKKSLDLSGGRASPDKLSSIPQNPLNRSQISQASNSAMSSTKPLNKIEIHRNPPSQSRNAFYTTNSQQAKAEPEPQVERKNGVEIRSDDIRAATSFRLKDRSVKLPEPTAVSDSPGRPIVSFDTNWQPPEESTDISPDRPPKISLLDVQVKSHQKPPESMAIPIINVAEVDPPRPQSTASASIPSISVAGCDDPSRKKDVAPMNIPTIAVEDESATKNVPSVVTPRTKQAGSSRPLPAPTPSQPKARKVQMPRGHWSPAVGSIRRPTTSCHECGFPIEGRFVALGGSQERFHPQCFSCFSCGTSLEAMEISPEPELQRKARLERIRRREAGEILDEVPGMTMEEDGDERLRFYCHLDWHELFAPRCKHCQTPILGEHIVALGEHWHYGHFFCAECGDPFEHGMTHIEKDGYAWCIKCQTKRTERRAPKCKMCKKAVIGQYIQALGGEWHEHCFRCAQCEGGFVDGQIFTKEVKGVMVVLCTDCRTRDLKA
ncbi:LIM domain protein [Metarhizium brunneum]